MAGSITGTGPTLVGTSRSRPSRSFRPDGPSVLEPRRVLSSTTTGTVIVGAVVDATTAAGVGGVRVQLVGLAGSAGIDPRVVRQTTTDASGRFAFKGFRRGDFVVREAGESPSLPDHTFLNGVPVTVGEVDPVTGGAYPAIELGYTSNHTVLTASVPGPTVAAPIPALGPNWESGAAIAFEAREYALKEFLRDGDGRAFDDHVSLITRGSILGVEGLTIVLHLL